MAITLEEMEKRLAKLEAEVAQLKHWMERRQMEETAAERGARLLREAKAKLASRRSAQRWPRRLPRWELWASPSVWKNSEE